MVCDCLWLIGEKKEVDYLFLAGWGFHCLCFVLRCLVCGPSKRPKFSLFAKLCLSNS